MPSTTAAPIALPTLAARGAWKGGFIGLFAFILAGIGAFAQTPKPANDREEAPAFNDWAARSFLIEVEPLVEKYTGWKSPDFPKFKVVTRDEYSKATVEELLHFVYRPMGVQADAQTSAALVNEVKAHSAGLLGRYSFLSKTIFLLAGNLKPVMHALHVEDRFTRDLVEIIVAHEMTHAFQDAQHPFTARDPKTTDPDAAEAYAMLTEGHAMFVQQMVADELKVAEAARTMAEEMAHRENLSSQASHSSAETVMKRYTAGLRFVEAVYNRGGLVKVQALFDHPPKSPAFILDPELFFASEAVATSQPAR